jgi:elongation factor 1 alpha-like protein
MAAGRLESGYLLPHTRILVVPGHEVASVKHLAVNGSTAPVILAGDNADIGLGGIEEAVLSPGCVLSWPTHPARAVTRFKAQIALFGSTTASGASSDGAMQATTMPLVPGQQFMLHSHTAAEPCNVTRLLRTLDRDGHTKERKPRCVTAGQVAVVRIRLARPVCLDTFAEHKRLGRFLLRYSGKSVAAGMVLKITA